MSIYLSFLNVYLFYRTMLNSISSDYRLIYLHEDVKLDFPQI